MFHQPFYIDLKTQAHSDLNCFAYQAYDNTRIKKKTYTNVINKLVFPIYITALHGVLTQSQMTECNAVVRENLEYQDFDCFSWLWQEKQYVHR